MLAHELPLIVPFVRQRLEQLEYLTNRGLSVQGHDAERELVDVCFPKWSAVLALLTRTLTVTLTVTLTRTPTLTLTLTLTLALTLALTLTRSDSHSFNTRVMNVSPGSGLG